MRSRKTLELILAAENSNIVGIPTFIFYPAGAERWGDEGAVSSRLGLAADGVMRKLSHPAIAIPRNLDGFISMVPNTPSFIGFDDAQFFNNNIVGICRKLRNDGHTVYIAGLDMDSFMQPFGPMPYLMALADKVTKHTSICVDCKDIATVTYRLVNNEFQEFVGDEEYIPLCLDCYNYRVAQMQAT
jgi:thymidine kinase